MERDDVDKLMGWLHDAFPGLTVEQISLYSSLLAKESDTAAASRAVLRGIKEWNTKAPSYAALHDMIKAEKPIPAEHRNVPERYDKVMPNWVRRFVCARFLFATFGREQDLRMFPEMADMYGYDAPPDAELMPEDEWVKEAATVDLATAWKIFLSQGDEG